MRIGTGNCDECGARLIEDCIYCGAPICCPSCCTIANLREENARYKRSIENMEKEIKAHLAENQALLELYRGVVQEHQRANDCSGPGEAMPRDCQWCADAKAILNKERP